MTSSCRRSAWSRAGVDFSNLFVTLGSGRYDTLAQAKQAGAATLNIGVFINNLIAFLIVAAVLFMVIKAMNRLRRKQKEDPKSEPASLELLQEIRDAIVKR